MLKPHRLSHRVMVAVPGAVRAPKWPTNWWRNLLPPQVGGRRRSRRIRRNQAKKLISDGKSISGLTLVWKAPTKASQQQQSSSWVEQIRIVLWLSDFVVPLLVSGP